MSNRFSDISGLKRHRIVFWLINFALVSALVIFALRGQFAS
jgi:stress-induced morphogen